MKNSTNKKVVKKSNIVDFHQLDECDCGEAMLDHWRTDNGDGTFWATWECPKCGYFDGRTEDEDCNPI